MSPATRINAAIAGGKVERETAYAALTALAHGDNPDVAATFASASLHISGGLEVAELDEETRLAQVFGQFGTVLAVTLRGEGSTSWALLTFGQAEEAHSAVAGVASQQGLVVRALNTQQALGEPGEEGEATREHRERVSVGVALSCIAPLVETVFAADVAQVAAAEYQKAAAVLMQLIMVDPLAICAEYCRDEKMVIVWKSMGNAYNAVFKKEPSELTRDDVLTVAADNSLAAAYWTRGFDAVTEAAGMTFSDWVGFGQHNKLLPGNTSEALLERLLQLALEVARDPQGASELTQAGVWQIFGWGLGMGRAALAMPLLEAGLLEAMVASLKRTSPVEWMTWKTPTGMCAGGILLLGWTLSTLVLPGWNKTEKLIDTGFVDVCIASLKAFELRGVGLVGEANVLAVEEPLNLFAMLDLTTPEAAPIVRQLEDMPTTLRFILDNNISHIKDIGYTTASMCALVCALALGKQEGGDFEFTQEVIEATLTVQLAVFSGSCCYVNPVLEPFFLRSVVHLCISDANKKLLLHTSEPIKLIMEALLLDPEHVRNRGDFSQRQEVRGAIQRDAAECFMQLVLFDPSQDMLKQEPSVLDALRMLVDKALTEEARQYAEGALMILDPEAAAHDEVDVDTQHVMVSYQWAAQPIIKRIVTELQDRHYSVWFDLERMQGSVMDAMSEAIEGAEVMCYGVSSLYKESANCRLEASYAVQQGLDMIPMMMQENFKAKGWLGLILGTRMYYKFYPSAVETDVAFTQQMDSLTREIGGRGKFKLTSARVSEAVPPAPAQASAQAQTPAPAPAPALAQVATLTSAAPNPSLSPSTTQMSLPLQEQQMTGFAGDLTELASFMEKQQMRDDKIRTEMDSKIDEMRAEMKQQFEELTPTLQPAVSAEQIVALQARIAQLHSSQLLSLEELHAAEDLVTDWLELQASAVNQVITHEMMYSTLSGDTFATAIKVHKMVSISQGIAADDSLARQIKRKFL